MDALEDYRKLENQWSQLQTESPIGMPCYVIMKCSCGRSINCKDKPHGNQKFLDILEVSFQRSRGEKLNETRRCLKLVRRTFNITHIGQVGKTVFFDLDEAKKALYSHTPCQRVFFRKFMWPKKVRWN